MKSKGDLFHLIQAMSKSEKRYFTLDAQKSGRKDARYLELFQVMNEQETYDEAPLKEKFGKTLPTAKAYLYEAILRSMRDYRSANSHAARIKEMIMDARYLYERGLYELSEERLHNAKKLASELSDQVAIIELNKEHRRLLKYTKRKGYEQELEELIAEKVSNLIYLNEELHYLDIHDHLLIEVRKYRQGLTDAEKEYLKKRFKDLTDDAINPVSFQGRLRYYKCMALFHQLLNNSKEVYDYYTKIVSCWEESPKYKAEDFYQYILDISNFIHILLPDSNKAGEINALLSKLENENPANLHNQNVLFQRITSFRILYSINTGDFKEIHLLIKRIEKGLKQYDISPATEASIVFNVAVLSFMAGQYDLCQAWSIKILQQRKLNVRQDIQGASRIVYLLATFELDSFEETEAWLRNTLRYFQKYEHQESKFYINILNYIKKMHSGTVKQNSQAQKQLREYIKNSNDQVPLGIDELLEHWLESKLTKRTIAEIIKIGLTKSIS